jgi:aspartyl-tRNA(Asn)/glutamyl-tRNA(Gln) amidotransferase subunit C
MSEITEEMVRQVAFLGRLKLEGQELKALAGQLDQILAYVRQLQAVPTEGIEPTSHVLPLTNVLRQDEEQPSLPAHDVLRMAPAAVAPFVTVPKVLE